MMIVMDPDLPEEEIGATLSKLKGIIEKNGGKVEKVDEWGKRSLAYEIRHKKEGFYSVFYFKANPQLLDELKKEIRMTPQILRELIIRRGG